MKAILRLEIPAEYLSISKGMLFFLVFLGLIASLYFFYLAFASLKSANWFLVSIFAVIGISVLWGLCIYPMQKRNNTRALEVELFEGEVRINYAKKVIPLKLISIQRGEMFAEQISNRGLRTTYNVGSAIILKIENFKEYFDLSLSDSFSPIFNEPDNFKIPVGERGVSEAQAKEFLDKVHDLKK